MRHVLKVAGILAAGLLVACGALAQSQSDSSASSADKSQAAEPDINSLIPQSVRTRYAHAVWTYPKGNHLADLYPPRALSENQQGAVVLACTINTNGTFDKCGVMAENPKGYDFGMATATAFIRYAHVDPKTVGGGIQTGDFWVFLYRWVLG